VSATSTSYPEVSNVRAAATSTLETVLVTSSTQRTRPKGAAVHS